MREIEEVELTNMCMILDGQGNVLLENKVGNPNWHGWIFPGGHVEKGEYITPSVIREIREETGLTISSPKLCGIKEFHRKDGKRYIVFLYSATSFTGELINSDEGNVFWHPLSELAQSEKLIGGFREMLKVFLDDSISEMYHTDSSTVTYC